MGEALIALVYLGVLGIGAWLVEAVWQKPEPPESITDAQTTSERGLW